MKDKLRVMQEEVDKEYAENGFSDELLEKQVEINQLRHEHGIVDEDKLVYKEFSQ